MSISLRSLGPDDVALLNALAGVFGEAFDEVDTFAGERPARDYLRRLLSTDDFVAVAALANGKVVGGLAAYVLRKFERERSEVYLYDLAVAQPHRRQGVATALIRQLQHIAAEKGAYVIFVQADPGDRAAIELYSKLGVREQVLHFDIPVK